MPARFHKHAMIGEGGTIRVPRSESGELDRALSLLNGQLDVGFNSDIRGDLKEVKQILERLRKQASEGYHRNPGVYDPFKIVGVLSHDARSVAYRHAKDSKLYKHDFERNSAEVLAVLRHGKRELLLTSPDGLPLWDEF